MPKGGYISIQITGLKTTRRRIVTWGANIQSVEPAMKQIGMDLLDDFRWQITSEGGTLGGLSRWPPLRPGTVRWREKHYPGFGAHPIMWLTGRLLYSLASRGADGNVFETTPTSVTVGTNVPYARYHQTGTRKMARRQLVGLSWRRRSGIVARLNEYVQDQAREQGLNVMGGGA